MDDWTDKFFPLWDHRSSSLIGAAAPSPIYSFAMGYKVLTSLYETQSEGLGLYQFGVSMRILVNLADFGISCGFWQIVQFFKNRADFSKTLQILANCTDFDNLCRF